MSQSDKAVKLPVLCPDDQCTACSACFNACRHGAIRMEEDRYGEHHPQIDAQKCVGCGLCERVCPELPAASVRRNGKPRVYYCWLKQPELRRESTSGGAAYAISRAVIRKGGHVWGAAYNDGMQVCYTEAVTLEGLRPIQKSKYVQSHVGDCFRRIKEQLDRGELVLFAGTGCHVKGLRSFLRKDYPNLLTLDLVCHGVPGQGVFRKFKEWLERRYGDRLVDYIPRHKQKGGQEVGYYTLAVFEHKGEVRLQRRNNGYFVGFQHNLFLRTACHSCAANGEERFSDFTVADFWGLGKVEPFTDHLQRTRGISMLALNSPKAEALFEEFKDGMVYSPRTYKEASFSNTQYYKPAVPSPRRAAFREEWDKLPWEELVAKYMRYTPKELVLYAIKKFTPPDCLSHVKSLAKWVK